MLERFTHERIKAILVIPGAYFLFSRLRKPRDLLINAIQWAIPSALVGVVFSNAHSMSSIYWLAVGFIIFVSMYELGYIANDSYGLKNDDTPRRRVRIRFSIPFVVTFVMVRGIAFGGLAIATDLASDMVFLLSYTGLAATLIAHNLLAKVQFKFFTFFQLSLFRFTLPVLPLILHEDRGELLPALMVTGLALFSFPRLLTYLDAKGRLSLEERKDTNFLFFGLTITLPIVIAIAAATMSWASVIGWGWAVLAQLTYLRVAKYNTLC